MNITAKNPSIFRLQDALRSFRNNLMQGFFTGVNNPTSRIINLLWLGLLFLTGLFAWGDLLSWGRIPFDLADWGDITGPRLTFQQEALRSGTLPLHIDQVAGMKGATDRFLSIPDVILSPQVGLLSVMDTGSFVLTNVLLFYVIGFIGLLLIMKRYKLSSAAFTPLFALFFFNGHIIDHISIGHLTWCAYFLLPIFALLILQFIEGENQWDWIPKISLLLSVIWLQGGFHQYIWCLILLCFLLVFYWHGRKNILLAIIFSISLNLYRILPAALVSVDLRIGFQSGFTTLGELLSGLVVLRPISSALETLTPLNPLIAWWEFDHFIGWIGLAFITGFCIWLGWRRRQDEGTNYLPFWGILLALTVISIGRIYRIVFSLGIPLLTGERVTSRLFIIPLLFALILAAVSYQRWLNLRGVSNAIGFSWLGGFMILSNDLAQHHELWKVNQLEALFASVPAIPLHVSNHYDPDYSFALIAGFALSILALGILFILAWKNQQRA